MVLGTEEEVEARVKKISEQVKGKVSVCMYGVTGHGTVTQTCLSHHFSFSQFFIMPLLLLY